MGGRLVFSPGLVSMSLEVGAMSGPGRVWPLMIYVNYRIEVRVEMLTRSTAVGDAAIHKYVDRLSALPRVDLDPWAERPRNLIEPEVLVDPVVLAGVVEAVRGILEEHRRSG